MRFRVCRPRPCEEHWDNLLGMQGSHTTVSRLSVSKYK